MYKDSKGRTLLKTVTWRITATLTTVILVYIFTGQIDTAIEVGMLEMLAKMLFYFLHERGWEKVKWGRQEIPSFVLWITGIPRSGKTTLGDMVYKELEKEHLKLQRLDSHDVRPLFPETGFTRGDVNIHIKRVGHIASMLEKNGVITIASFVSPYIESRDFIRNQCKNFVEIHLNTTLEKARLYDTEHLYDKADQGKIKNLPGYDVDFEISEKTELEIDMTSKSLDEAKKEVLKFLNSRYLG